MLKFNIHVCGAPYEKPKTVGILQSLLIIKYFSGKIQHAHPVLMYTTFILNGGGGEGGGAFTLNSYKNLEYTQVFMCAYAYSYSTNHSLHVNGTNCGEGVYIVTNHPLCKILVLKRGIGIYPRILLYSDYYYNYCMYYRGRQNPR